MTCYDVKASVFKQLQSIALGTKCKPYFILLSTKDLVFMVQ